MYAYTFLESNAYVPSKQLNKIGLLIHERHSLMKCVFDYSLELENRKGYSHIFKQLI